MTHERLQHSGSTLPGSPEHHQCEPVPVRDRSGLERPVGNMIGNTASSRRELTLVLLLMVACAPEPRTGGFALSGPGGAGGGVPQPQDASTPVSGNQDSGGQPATGPDAGSAPRLDAAVVVRDASEPPPDAAPPGPVEVATQPVFFSGEQQAPSPVVPRDPGVGFFYVNSPSTTVKPELKVVQLDAEARAGLPAGLTWAQQVNTGGDARVQTIFGWNFRPSDGEAWRWVDARGYAGVAFWIKSTLSGNSGSVLGVDRSAIPMGDPRGGTCPEATRAMCPNLPRAPITLTQTWTEVKLPWAAFVQSAESGPHPLEPEHLGRLDLLFVTPLMSPTQLWVTGVRFYSSAE